MAVRLFNEATGLSFATSGIVLSTLAGAIAVVVIWWVVDDVLGEQAATWTVAFVCFFPMAFVLSMVYTESLFLLVSAGGLLAVRRERWLLAGLLASIACLIRAPGLTMVAVVVVGVAVQVVRQRRITLGMCGGIVLSVAGFIGWCGYQSAQWEIRWRFSRRNTLVGMRNSRGSPPR